ncbi:redoxin domain-containing protein [Mucilaginibacter sp. UR6-1]|uniref:TlpA disulfide reductase family protein n=1 Tax=Mucilaginibacter sp. UR6-1 TaxID=1435643 RepID=UPI001E47C059|nr:TlpA disulfide reductase family protein [Mucilaginibacter sp. UR6-1]MCC8407454.1 redoxin domain-containing protein [Mucilaginibacter sp. UR6-1]
MKNFKLLSALLLPLLAQSTFAQTAERLKLSASNPAANQKITFTYDTTGANLGGKPEATVHFLEKTYPVSDVELTEDGKLFKGEFTVPATATSFFVRLANGQNIDNNSGKGYIYEVYKGGKPVEGAYANEAYLIQSGMGNYFGKINADIARAGELYKKEFALYPKSEKEHLLNYLMYLSSVKDPANKAVVDSKLAALGKSKDEKDLMTLSNWYSRQRKTAQADSVNAIIKAKFTKGEFAKNEAGMAFNKEKDLTKKEALLNDYLAKYPENKDNASLIDNFRMQLASAYLQAGNDAGYQKYAAQIKDKSNLASALNSVAWPMAEKGENLEKAAKYSMQSLEILDAAYANPKPAMFQSVKQAKTNNRASYYMFADTYAFIKYKQGDYAEALKYQQKVYDSTPTPDAEITEHYALILSASGQADKAKEIIEKSLQDGKGSTALRAELKKIYIKQKGNETGFDAYVGAFDKAAKEKAREELAKSMINETAPAFALKDFDGKEVSLASLKGKVVVIDFWATWCGPCKASFPGMQLAVNKYKDNPNVKFLFIDTWESGDNYVPGVKKFIADNKYTFHVLIDEKGTDGRQSKVVSSFNVTGIPTKFIIDQTGNIRFKHVGFSGTDEGVLNEVSSMVDMLASPTAAKADIKSKAISTGK